MMTASSSPIVLPEAFPVNQVCIHVNPDIDEVVAVYALKSRGTSMFPGIENAGIEFEAERYGKETAAELEDKGVLCVGTRGGRFDEHAHGKSEARSEECSATLVANALGIRNDPGFKLMLDYAYAKDKGAHSHEWELGPICKLAFRYAGDLTKAADVMYACFLLLDGVRLNEEHLARNHADRPALATATMSMDSLINAWLIRKYGEPKGTCKIVGNESASCITARKHGKEAMACLKRFLTYATENKEADRAEKKTKFMLANLFRLAQQHAVAPMDDLIQVMYTLLDGIFAKEYGFHTLCAQDFRAASTHSTFVEDTNIEIISVISDNPEISKYCRMQGAWIVIQQNLSGNTQIFCKTEVQELLVGVIGEIRPAEYSLAGLPSPTDEEKFALDMGKDGRWYFAGHSILNGSLTTKLPPTRLSRIQIEQLVYDGIMNVVMQSRKKK